MGFFLEDGAIEQIAKRVERSGNAVGIADPSLVTVHNGDCLAVMNSMPPNHFHSIVTDPPAGISFMGNRWDDDKGGKRQWKVWMQARATECLRVARPGAYALVWALPRTSHWTADAWEDAGWDVRDRVSHLFGSGFPKSHDVSRAVDERLGEKPKVVGKRKGSGGRATIGPIGITRRDVDITEPVSDDARKWGGYGTALKPAVEDWFLLQKPFNGTIADNVLKWGCGALNVDGCRISGDDSFKSVNRNGVSSTKPGWGRPWKHDAQAIAACRERAKGASRKAEQLGRWPANLCHDGSEEVEASFATFGNMNDDVPVSRFFYSSKADETDRAGSRHPTVKNLQLMRWLVRLVSPPDALILDPFAGTGTTGEAAMLEGFKSVLIEKEQEYYRDIVNRLRIYQAKETHHAKCVEGSNDREAG